MSPAIRRTLIILLLVVGLVFGVVIGRQVLQVGAPVPEPAPELTELNTYVYEQPRPVADFQLQGETGEPRSAADLKGRWTVAFLGYTNCPDVCPATMALLKRADALLDAQLPEPEFLLISTDPERDTPERLESYLTFFGDNFRGLTGDMDGLRALAKSLNGVFVHREPEAGMVLVDHSAHLALINPDGELAAVIQPPHSPEQIAEAYERIYQWAYQRKLGAG
ncbi:MAG: SCO family protein [Marinobacter sp.]|uniref:SCO family protein n=1 Tax=Marinobacter sp. TaxID=50741 RepID=UPI00299D0098|nr:SCO family protein [Marinobacter sp.]MDX1634157.1 SCO family protein [Marinobacter sp.]